MRTDGAPAQILIGVRVDDRVGGRLRVEARRDLRVGRAVQRKDARDGEAATERAFFMNDLIYRCPEPSKDELVVRQAHHERCGERTAADFLRRPIYRASNFAPGSDRPRATGDRRPPG